MEPFECFFRVLFSNAIDFKRMRKTCTATLCAPEGMFYRMQCRSFETLHCDISFSYTDFSFLQELEGKRMRSALAFPYEVPWRFHTKRNDASSRCFGDAGFFVIALTVPIVIRVHY